MRWMSGAKTLVDKFTSEQRNAMAARHPKVVRAAAKSLREHGLSVAASRITTGNHPLYEQLERALEKFFRAESWFAALAFGRIIGSQFITSQNLNLPPALLSLCDQVPESEFRDDSSSSAIRANY